MTKKNIFVEGIPLRGGIKVIIISALLFLLLLNIVLPVIFPVLNYTGNMWVSIGIVSLAILFSLGSKTAESLVIGSILIVVISTTYDMAVKDISQFRIKLLIWSVVALIIATVFGRVSIINLFSIIKNQLGIGKK